jgi:hypothetical protein
MADFMRMDVDGNGFITRAEQRRWWIESLVERREKAESKHRAQQTKLLHKYLATLSRQLELDKAVGSSRAELETLVEELEENRRVRQTQQLGDNEKNTGTKKGSGKSKEKKLTKKQRELKLAEEVRTAERIATLETQVQEQNALLLALPPTGGDNRMDHSAN